MIEALTITVEGVRGRQRTAGEQLAILVAICVVFVLLAILLLRDLVEAALG